jgi:outer membrane lipoprotein-sorting protein
VGVVGVVGLAAGGMLTATASPDQLPEMTTTGLLADVQTATVSGFSGTVVAQMSLGLPSIPAIGGSGDSQASVATLLTGSHTLRFWYGGADRQRVALLGVTSETDFFHLGRDVWQWDSATHVATHTTLPARPAAAPTPLPTATEDLTPPQLAAQALAAIRPSTLVTIGQNRVVADRSAYDLVLTPRDSATRIGSVHIAVDGATKMPLGVQVYARGETSPAVDVAFSSVSFTTPSAKYFRFAPPPGATVRTGTLPPDAGAPANAAGAANDPVTVTGSGWTAVAEYRGTPKELASISDAVLSALPRVSGSWGDGRLMESALASVLVMGDGRVFAGAVDPAALYAAASTHK